jgi:inner membrane protein
MDNVCHTLVGGALARTGFDKRTPLATATMMIGANFPDIDVIAVPLGTDIGFRRGITHGIPAHIVLPFVLAGLMLAWDRWVRRRRDPTLPPAIPKEILLVSAISIATHPFMDWLNSYGMRWLMPMRNEWYYGDSIFIVDLWLWIVLFLGFRLSKRWNATRPARIAVGASAAYILAMAAGTLVVRNRIERAVGAVDLTRRELMVAPVALNPFARQVILSQGGFYRTGEWRLSGGITWGDSIRTNRDDPAAALAMRDPALAPFLHWARFPFFIVNRAADGRTVVNVADARYSGPDASGWASRSVVIPAVVSGLETRDEKSTKGH